jgi:integrase/recombinase XerD
MFDKLFERTHALNRQLAGPLVEERQRYLLHCAAQGMKIATLKTTAHYLMIVADYLALGTSSDSPVSLEAIENAAERWAKREPKPPRMRKDRYARLRFICFATRFLNFVGRIETAAVIQTPFDDLLAGYTRYMRHERGLSECTIELRHYVVRDFLKRICDGGLSLRTVNVDQIDGILAEKVTAGRYARVTVQTCASSLRGFFRYAETQGLCMPGLAVSIMAPRVFQHESLPSGPTWENVQKILDATAGDRPAAIRDHAILLLLAVYGVRAGEVARLRLGDIDWQGETIVFTRSKLLGTHSFPLCQSVGDAVIRYLKEVRPTSSHRELFLTMRAPYRPITSGTLWPVVARRLQVLGLSIKHHGPHSLRHACATRLINEGLSLKEVGDHLGHRGPETTRIYAKVDLVRLREVASFDLGGLL